MERYHDQRCLRLPYRLSVHFRWCGSVDLECSGGKMSEHDTNVRSLSTSDKADRTEESHCANRTDSLCNQAIDN